MKLKYHGEEIEVEPVFSEEHVSLAANEGRLPRTVLAGYVGKRDDWNWISFRATGTPIESVWVHSIRCNAVAAVEAEFDRRQRIAISRKKARLRRPPDTQKFKLYAAEVEAFQHFPLVARTLEGAHQWAVRVVPVAGRSAASVPRFRSGRKNQLRWLYVDGAAQPIHIQLNSYGIARDWVIVHELAHVYDTRDPYKFASHDRVFAALYLNLVRVLLGHRWGARLQAAFDKRKVKYRAERAKRNLTDEQRAVLRERLVKARAAKQEKKAS